MWGKRLKYSQIMSISISDATSTTKILEQTRGTIAKTQYYRNPNIRDGSNNVVKPNYKNRYIIMPYELDTLLTFEDFLLSITDLELLTPYSKKQMYNKDVTKRPLSILNDKRELMIQSQVDNYVQEFDNIKWFDIIKQLIVTGKQIGRAHV